MGKATENPIRLFLREERSGRYYHLTANVVEIRPDGEIRSCDRHGGLFLSNLEVNSQGNDEDRERREGGPHLYAWTLAFRPHQVGAREAAAMVRTFKVLDRILGVLDAKDGPPVTFGEYLGRVALALGAEGFVVGQRLLDIRDGMAEADAMADRWIREERQG